MSCEPHFVTMSSQVASSSADSPQESGGHPVGGAGSKLHPQGRKYDVFISHRGPDVKKSFVAHLADALEKKKIIPFVDKDALVTGEDAFVAMKSALEAAPVLLAIFSPGYAESVHCLNELVQMLECCRKNSNVVLVPVFYNVKPMDLRWLHQGPFKHAFEKHEKRGQEIVLKGWKDALNEVSKITGFELCEMGGNENELKLKIVARIEEILRRLNGPMMPVSEHTVGLGTSIELAKEELARMEDIGAIYGICGMGGIGKTTFATKLYNHFCKKYDFCTFLTIGEADDLRHLQKQVLYDFFKIQDDNAANQYNSYFQSRLDGQSILVVMDDMRTGGDKLFLKLLPGMEKLATGSRIIVTSRDRDVLKSLMHNKRESSYLHEMQVLDDEDSFELFCFQAFDEDHLPLKRSHTSYPLAKEVSHLCSGLPLALEVIGKHLYTRQDNLAVWAETVKTLKTHDDILIRLSISYKSLSECDKLMFLDICCQMVGLSQDDALDIWESCEPCSSKSSNCRTSKSVNTSLSTLLGKCLVKVDKDNKLRVHDLLREMGRAMVNDDNSRRLGEHSHLWNPKDVKQILKKGEGTARIRGLSMAGLESKGPFDASKFEKLGEVHLMQLDGVRIEGDFSKWPKTIRWLQWTCSSLTRIPGSLRFKYLTILDLSESLSLTRLWPDGDTQTVPKRLKVLRLDRCTALEEIPESVEFLTLLKELNLRGSKELRTLPRTIGKLTGLQILNLDHCWKLEGLPDEIGNLASLKRFSMNWCGKITELPESFGNLESLVIFWADGASSLTCLPRSFSRMSHLEEFSLGWCRFLSKLPQSVEGLVKLRVFRACDTAVKELPRDFGTLGGLVDVKLEYCKFLESLPESFGMLMGLKTLSLKGCRRFRKLSGNFGLLQNLTSLNLDECAIEDGDLPDSFGALRNLNSLSMGQSRITRLPESFSDLTALTRLDMRRSRDLIHTQSLPSFLEDLDLGDCKNLESIVLEKLTKLKTLILCNCTWLTSIQGLGSMRALEELNISGCSNLVEIDDDDLLLRPTMERCFLSGSKMVLKYNSDWSQEFPSCQVVSYYDHTMGFVENTMAHKVTVRKGGNELCMETTISSAKRIDAIVIIVVAHRPRSFMQRAMTPALKSVWLDFYRFSPRVEIEARVVRSGVVVEAFDRVINLRYVDVRDQVFICTLRKSHSVTKVLERDDRLCVYARPDILYEACTVMEGTVLVAHEDQDPDLRDKFGKLSLRDNMSK